MACGRELGDHAFFAERADCVCADFEFNFFAINKNGFFLKVWFPDFFCTAKREAHVVAVLFAFAC